MKKNLKRVLIAFAVIFVLGVIVALPDSDNGEQTKERNPSQSHAVESEFATTQSKSHDVPLISYIDTSGYTKMCADVLYEYGNYMQGEKVLTVFEIKDSSGGLLKANTENNESFFFSITCDFHNSDYTGKFEEGTIVTVAGEIVENASPVGQTVSLDKCYVIGYGEISDELKAGAQDQRLIGEEYKAKFEKDVANAAQNDKYGYISQCVSLDYNEIERNPDTYKGQKARVSGEVVQVSEGIFDSVTLRVDSGGGDMWYVTYTRKEGESRILEGDNITCYGECDGVRSYTTIVGSQVTIPSLKMKYYD